MIYDILEPVRNDFLSQVSGMTSSFRRRKKSVRQKTEQRLKAKKIYNLEAFDECPLPGVRWKISSLLERNPARSISANSEAVQQ